MKIQKIKKLIAASKRCEIYSGAASGTQWIGDGIALYPLEGLPELDENGIRTLLDIPETKWADFAVYDNGPSEWIDDDNIALLAPTTDSGNWITYKGMEMAALESDLGIMFIQPMYLEPPAGKETTLWIGELCSGQKVVVCKDGMFTIGIIPPVAIKPEASLWLSDIATAAAKNVTKERGNEEDPN